MKNEKLLTYKDVMYGDIVAIEDFDIDKDTYDLVRNIVPCKVVGFIEGNTILEYENNNKESTLTAMQEFKPFEITKSVLEKNGFKESSENVYELNFNEETKLTIVLESNTIIPFAGLVKPNCSIGVYEKCPLHVVQHILNGCGLEMEWIL